MRRRSRGQALVEMALVAPLLIVLSLGATDFGRAFGTNDAVNGATREAARQAAYFDPVANQNPLWPNPGTPNTNGVLQIAQKELGQPGMGTSISLGPAGGWTPCPGWTTPPSSAYPSQPGTGYLYVCWVDPKPGDPGTSFFNTADNRKHVTVAILWRMQMLSPIVGVTGIPLLHAVVDATLQSNP